MNRSESKFHNTAVKFDIALLELLEHNEFTEISIMDICKKAGVNRSTFYLHYGNTYDLLKETRQYLIDEFISGFQTDISLADFDKLPADDLIFASPEYIVPYLEFIKTNKTFYKVYMNNLDNFEVDSMDKMLIDNVIAPVLAKFGITDKSLVNYMSKYYLNGITAIALEWVKHDCADDIMFIYKVINQCVRPLGKDKL